MEIRKAKLSDAPGLARLYLQFWDNHERYDPLLRLKKRQTLKSETEQARKDIRKRNHAILVAVEDGQVIGFTEVLIKRREPIFKVKTSGYINSIVVGLSHRESGVGTALVLHALEFFKGKGIRHVKTNAYLHNKAALAMYGKTGFKAISSILIKDI